MIKNIKKSKKIKKNPSTQKMNNTKIIKKQTLDLKYEIDWKRF